MRSDQTNRPSSRNSSSGARRFSVIELVVAAVIALLLVAAVFPVRAMVQFQKEKKDAYNRALHIEFAIGGYEGEYRKLPIDPTAIKDDFYETVSGEALMGILHGGEHPMNPLGTKFYFDPVDPDITGEIRDPWGNLYHVRIDSNNDKWIDLPEECAGDTPKKYEGKIREKVIVWSKGKERDGKFEGPETWIKSWNRP